MRPKAGSDVFLRLPGESEEMGERVLHPGCVAEDDFEHLTADFHECDLQLEEGLEFILYFHHANTFMQVPARIDEILASSPALRVAIATIGDPISAEGREYFRVSALGADLTVEVGDEKECPLVDASAQGFAIYSAREYAIGAQLPATIRRDGEYSGKVSVQSVRRMGKGRTRYGLHCISDRGDRHLLDGLNLLSMTLQRLQLRRISGGS